MSLTDKVGGRSLAIFYDMAYPFTDGGGQRRLYEVGRRLVSGGWTVHWFALKTWEGDSIREQNGIVYFGLQGHTKVYGSNGKRSLREALSYGKAVLFEKTDFSKYDLVWCGQWPIFHILALVIRLVPWRTRLLVDWWEVWGRYWFEYAGMIGLGGWILEVVLSKSVTRMGYAVVDSKTGWNRFLSLGAQENKIALIPNGVNFNELTQGEPEKGQTDIAYFGRLKGHKNIDHLIRALAILKERDNRRLTADIIGDGPERSSLEDLAHSLGIADQIVFQGRVETEQAKALLKRAQVFVHPSTQECGGSVNLLEANACGLPVVCYHHPMGIDPSQVKSGETGLMLAPVNPFALADGILEMLDLVKNRDIREQCIAHARSFDWNVIAERYRVFLEDIIFPKL